MAEYFNHGEAGACPRDHRDRVIDFGRTADDYDRYRPGFPASCFDRLLALGWIAPGHRALDVGTGTGAMALELAARGLIVTALDRSPELLAVLARRAERRGLTVRTVEGLAENTREPAASYALVTAAQCWWWFEPERALAEMRRILVSGGRAIIAGFCYLPLKGTVARRTEALILEHNPGWKAFDCPGIFPEQANQLATAGFKEVETFSYDVEVPFTHESWRGRIRACNGVAASLSDAEVAAFDAELAEVLYHEFPGALSVLHRVFIATATT